MDQPWTVKSILEWIEGYLVEHGDANPRLSAQWLVADALGCKRVELFTDLARPLSADERATLRDYTKRRGAKEPLQYITGTTDFRFVTLAVEPGVLIPRPETEVLVSEALAEVHQAFPWIDDTALPAPQLRVADVCTGSGNIACSIAAEVFLAKVWATDVSPEACALARRNAEELGLSERIEIIQCNLGDGIDVPASGGLHLVISNPPYIPSAQLATLDREVRDFEPALALDGGKDGLDVLRELAPWALRALVPGGVFAVELHEDTLEGAAELARSLGFDRVRIARDLAGRNRVLTCCKRV